MLKCFNLFVFGAMGYGLVELLWRGYTHWSMLLLGGVCTLVLYSISERKMALWQQAVLGALSITALELLAGLLFNQFLNMKVWDYSSEWGNLYGQICPRYTALWLLLCLPIFAIFRHYRISGVEKERNE